MLNLVAQLPAFGFFAVIGMMLGLLAICVIEEQS